MLCLLAGAVPHAAAAEARIIIQQSPLAGFQYYDGKVLWDTMKVGDTLVLVREPQNPHDSNAVRVEWKGQALGYVPRRDNTDIARQMDRGEKLQARIVRLTEARNPWQRVQFEVYAEMPMVKR
ncbi:MAG: HIRAN domain-containing protein [Burkholderiales bacterium]|nr:HIRAN domain-containing protein [Burkholderiales bacterium]